jgi:hypothetical protein
VSLREIFILTLQEDFHCLKKQLIIPIFLFLLCPSAFSQKTQFSLATDINLLRSFKMQQRYWSIGQTVNFHFHFTPKDGAYAWISYYSAGKFSNSLQASAKSLATIPQQVGYKNDAQLRFKHISIGWERYLKGDADAEKKWNLYAYAGFGLLLGSIVNAQSIQIDTSMYTVPVKDGKANFKRLTLDIGMTFEFPVGGDIFIYLGGRALVPTTDYPSPYLYINSNAPLYGTVNGGIRILFN